MSHRPINRKQAARMRKTLRRGTLPAHINLIEYLLDRRLAKTKREARDLILAKRVRVDSHPLGVKTHRVPKQTALAKTLGRRLPTADDFEEVEYVDPIVTADVRGKVQVVAA